MAERATYQVTEKEIAKAQRFARQAAERRENADANRAKLGRRYGLECRKAGSDALKGQIEYHRGIGQARYDRAMGLDYAEQRNESAYNLGYYRGYTDYERDIKGGLRVEIA